MAGLCVASAPANALGHNGHSAPIGRLGRMAFAGFFYVPSYTAIGLQILPGFFLGVLAGAIVLTWLYNSSGGSVMAAVLWHTSFNFVTASPNAAGLVAAVTSTLVMVWAVAVVWRYNWATLASPIAGRSVRATREEQTRELPGYERIPRAIDTLTKGCKFMEQRADTISDPAARESFLNAVAAHRELAQACESENGSSGQSN